MFCFNNSYFVFLQELNNKYYMEGDKVICADKPFSLEKGKCRVYSFGIGNQNWEFELDLAKEGCEVFVFDPDRDPDDISELHKNIRMHKYRIGVMNDKELRKGNTIHEWRRMTGIMDELKHLDDQFSVDYLNLDVAGDELNFLEDMAVLRPRFLPRFKQISIHINLGVYGMPSWRDASKYFRYFVALEKNGFRLFSSKTNPVKHPSYILEEINRVVHTHYDLVWGRCSKELMFQKRDEDLLLKEGKLLHPRQNVLRESLFSDKRVAPQNNLW